MSPESHQSVKEAGSFPTQDELAWFLGVICGNGFIGKEYDRRFFLTRSDEPEVLEEFQAIGQKLFGKKPKLQSNRVSFFGKQVISELGDLRNNTWPETIKLKHGWILNDPKHAWKFIEGLFDAKGNIQTKPKDANALYFRTNNLISAKFIENLLLNVGLKNPTVHSTQIKEQTLYTVGIYNIADLKVIADNVCPKSPEKQDKLKALKETPPPVTRQQLLDEYMRLSKLLGHFASSFELNKLYEEGETPFSRSVYERELGQGSFTEAKKTMLSEYTIITSRIIELAGPSFEAAQRLTGYLTSKSTELAKHGIPEKDILRHNTQIEEACDKILLATSQEEINQAVERLNLLLSRIQRKISTMTPLSVNKGRLSLQRDIL